MKYTVAVLAVLMIHPLAHAQAACNRVLASNADFLALQNSWPSIAAGSKICIRAGTYSQMLTVLEAHGSQIAPIVITREFSSSVVNLNGGVNIRSSGYVNIENVGTISNLRTNYAGILLDKGTHHAKVLNNTVRNSNFGIVLGSGTAGGGGPVGLGNVIESNNVTGHTENGITVQFAQGNSTDQTIIRSNSVTSNGGHGIDVESSSYVLVEGNIVDNNGLGVSARNQGGYSGIHLLSWVNPMPTDGDVEKAQYCRSNIFRYNIVTNTKEREAMPPETLNCYEGSADTVLGKCVDGNGIQVDHFCDFNTVSFNVSSGNAGSGVSVFTSGDNIISSNTLYGNNKQANRATGYSKIDDGFGELTVSSYVDGRARYNYIYDNIIYPTTSGFPGINVHSSAATSANRGGPNMFWVPGTTGNPSATPSAWPAQVIGGQIARTAADVDIQVGVLGNHIALPAFKSVTTPTSDGFQLKAKPSKRGIVPSPLWVDRLGLMPPASDPSYFGAYYK